MESEDSDAKKWVLAGVCLLMTDDWYKKKLISLILKLCLVKAFYAS